MWWSAGSPTHWSAGSSSAPAAFQPATSWWWGPHMAGWDAELKMLLKFDDFRFLLLNKHFFCNPFPVAWRLWELLGELCEDEGVAFQWLQSRVQWERWVCDTDRLVTRVRPMLLRPLPPIGRWALSVRTGRWSWSLELKNCVFITTGSV